MLREVEQFLSEERLGEAERHLEQVFAVDPGNQRAVSLLAKIQEAHHERQRRLEERREQAERDSEAQHLATRFGELLRQGQIEAVERELPTALESFGSEGPLGTIPEHLHHKKNELLLERVSEGQRQLESDDFQGAIASAAAALTIDPENEEANSLLAKANREQEAAGIAVELSNLLERGDLTTASRLLETAVVDFGEARFRPLVARLAHLQQEALEKQIRAELGQARSLLEDRALDDATRCIEEVLRLDPDREEANELLGEIETARRVAATLEHLGRLLDGSELEKVAAALPAEIDEYGAAALEPVTSRLKALEAQKRETIRAANERAAALLEDGATEDAISEIERTLELQPNDPVATALMAQARAAQRQHLEDEETAGRVARIESLLQTADFAGARAELASAPEELAGREEIARLSEHVEKLERSTLEFRSQLEQVLEQARDRKVGAAKKGLERAEQLLPSIDSLKGELAGAEIEVVSAEVLEYIEASDLQAASQALEAAKGRYGKSSFHELGRALDEELDRQSRIDEARRLIERLMENEDLEKTQEALKTARAEFGTTHFADLEERCEEAVERERIYQEARQEIEQALSSANVEHASALLEKARSEHGPEPFREVAERVQSAKHREQAKKAAEEIEQLINDSSLEQATSKLAAGKAEFGPEAFARVEQLLDQRVEAARQEHALQYLAEGETAIEEERFHEAEGAFSEALRLVPGHAAATEGHGKAQQAIALLDQIDRLRPKVEGLAAKQRYKAALKQLDRAESLCESGAQIKARGPLEIEATLRALRSEIESHLAEAPEKVVTAPRTLIAAAVLVVLALAVVWWFTRERPPPPVPTQLVVIDAVPWARVMAVRTSDESDNPAAAAPDGIAASDPLAQPNLPTPLPLELPVGSYVFELQTSTGEAITVEADVSEGQPILNLWRDPEASLDAFLEHLGLETAP